MSEGTELVRDKYINLLNETNNFKLQLWQQELLVEDLEGFEKPLEGDTAGTIAYSTLLQAATQAKAQVLTLRRRLEVRLPKLEQLKKEIDAAEQAAKAPL